MKTLYERVFRDVLIQSCKSFENRLDDSTWGTIGFFARSEIAHNLDIVDDNVLERIRLTIFDEQRKLE